MAKPAATHAPPSTPGSDQGKGPKPIEIEVNGNSVKVEEKLLTGAEIKQAAIDQGVNIQANFALYVDLANGSSEPVKNDQEIRVHPHMSFTAIAPDDNS